MVHFECCKARQWIGEQPKIAGIGTDRRRDIGSSLAWCRQTESPRSRRRCRYRAVNGAESLGTLDESEQTEGRSVRPFDGGGSLAIDERKSPCCEDERVDRTEGQSNRPFLVLGMVRKSAVYEGWTALYQRIC